MTSPIPDTSQKYDCGISPYVGGYKAWFSVPSHPDRIFLTAERNGIQKVIRFSCADRAWRAAKDRVLSVIQKDLEVWRETRANLGLKAAHPAELVKQAFGDADSIYLKGGKSVPVERKRKKVKHG